MSSSEQHLSSQSQSSVQHSDIKINPILAQEERFVQIVKSQANSADHQSKEEEEDSSPISKETPKKQINICQDNLEDQTNQSANDLLLSTANTLPSMSAVSQQTSLEEDLKEEKKISKFQENIPKFPRSKGSSMTYKIEKKIGDGCSAVVYLAKEFCQVSNSVKDNLVAIKKFKKHKASHFESEHKILQIISQDSHPNILKLRSVNKQQMEIESHYYPHGNLLDFVLKSHILKESQARFFFRGICDALLFLKNKNICHRDLKLENVLLDQDFNPVLIDFAFAAHNIPNFTEPLGTEGYQPPEMVLKQKYCGHAADSFSLGVMLFEMTMGKPPFRTAQPDSGLYQKFTLRNADYWEDFSKYNSPSSEAKDIINKLLSPDPASRPTLEQIYLMPWMSENLECERLSA